MPGDGSPPDWTQTKLGEVAKLQGGFAFPSDQFGGGPIPVVRMSDLRSGRLELSDAARVAESVARHHCDVALREGDLLIGMSGSLSNIAVVDGSDLPALLNQRVGRFVLLDPRRLHYRMLDYIICSDFYARQMRSEAVGVAQLNISSAQVEDTVIPLPPIPEQCRIAEILNTLDTTIRQTEVIIEKLKQVKQGLLHDLLTRGIDADGELRPPQSQAPHLYKDSSPGWIPMEWEVKSLGRVIADAYRYPSYFGIDYVDSGVPEVRGELIEADGTLDPRTANYRYISRATATRFTRVHLQQDDVVMSVRGTIGKFALVPGWLEGAVITANLLKLTPDSSVVRADWLIRLLLSQQFQDPLDAACSSTTIKTIQVPELMAIRIAVPSLAEQQTINERLRAIDDARAAELAALVKLTLQKSGLIDDLLSGRVRVTPLLV